MSGTVRHRIWKKRKIWQKKKARFSISKAGSEFAVREIREMVPALEVF